MFDLPPKRVRLAIIGGFITVVFIVSLLLIDGDEHPVSLEPWRPDPELEPRLEGRSNDPKSDRSSEAGRTVRSDLKRLVGELESQVGVLESRIVEADAAVFARFTVAFVALPPTRQRRFVADLIRIAADHQDRKPTVFDALGRIGPTAAWHAAVIASGEPSGTWLERRYQTTAYEALVSVGDPSMSLAQVIEREPHRAMQATTLFGRAALEGHDMGSALPALIESLRSESPRSQTWAAQALAHAGPRRVEAVRDLTTLLSSDVQQVRIEAAKALGEIGPGADYALADLERRSSEIGLDGGVEGASFRAAIRLIRND